MRIVAAGFDCPFLLVWRSILLVGVLALHFGTVASQTCFAASGNSALRSAVTDYINNGGPNSAAGRTYGADIGTWCVSRVTSFAQVFMNHVNFNLPLTGWNTSSATNFNQFFQNARAFNQPLGHFDTRRVTSMNRAFYNATSFTGQGLERWETSRVGSLYWTFRNSAMNTNIGNWNVPLVNDLRETFRNTPFNNNLCAWGNTLQASRLPSTVLTNTFSNSNCPVKTSPSFAVTPTSPLCYSCPPLRWGTDCFPAEGYDLYDAVRTYINEVQPLTTNSAKLAHPLSVQYGYPIGTWCTNDVLYFNDLFAYEETFNEPLTYWNTSSAISMYAMFSNARAFDQNLSHFDMSQVTQAAFMFEWATSFRGIGTENWNVGQVESFYSMFYQAWNFNADISRWDVRRGMDFGLMFESANRFNRDISAWRPQMATNMRGMFFSADAFNQSLCSWGQYLTPSTDVYEMFLGSGCQFQISPIFTWSPVGPLGTDCPGRTTALPSAVIGPFTLPIVPAAVTNRPDGMILAWSGDMPYEFNTDYPGDQPGTFIALFNPNTTTSSAMKLFTTQHRMFCPGTSHLVDGRLFITGGISDTRTSFYNPYNDTWSAGPQMTVSRGYHSQFTLSDGRVFTLGGSWVDGPVGNKFAEVFNPQTNQWSRKPGIDAVASVNTEDVVGFYRSDNHMWFYESTNGKILHVGPSKTMHWFNISGNGTVEVIGNRGDDLDAMNGGCAMFDIDRIITAGGAEQYDIDYTQASNRAYVIDISNGTNSPVVTRIPNMRFARTMISLVVLPNGHTLALGGQSSVALFSDNDAILYAEIYNPVTNTWSDLSAPMRTPRTYHSVGLLLKDGRVLHGGGGLCGAGCDNLVRDTWQHPNVEILTPPYLLTSAGQPVASRPSITLGPSTFTPNSQIAVTLANATAGSHTFALMKLGTSTHTVNLDQRRIPLSVVSRSGDVFTLQIPANPVHSPPGLYWLFAMDPNGVPSWGWDLRRA